MTKPKTSLLNTILKILLGSEKAKNRPIPKRRKTKGESRRDRPRKKPEAKEEIPRPASSPKPMVQTILNEAENLLGIPYKYAGTAPGEGFDCSGLVYYVFDRAGLRLQRASYLQAEEGERIGVKDTSPGDLIFFAHSGDRINHVGIVTSHPGEPLSMIHSSSSKGVIHTNVDASSYWKTRLKGARRVV